MQRMSVAYFYNQHYSSSHPHRHLFLIFQLQYTTSTESHQACHTSYQRSTRSRSKWWSKDSAYQDRTKGGYCVAWERFYCHCIARVEAQVWSRLKELNENDLIDSAHASAFEQIVEPYSYNKIVIFLKSWSHVVMSHMLYKHVVQKCEITSALSSWHGHGESNTNALTLT